MYQCFVEADVPDVKNDELVNKDTSYAKNIFYGESTTMFTYLVAKKQAIKLTHALSHVLDM